MEQPPDFAGMEDYPGSLAQGAVLFSDSVDWEEHAGAVQVTHVDVANRLFLIWFCAYHNDFYNFLYVFLSDFCIL